MRRVIIFMCLALSAATHSASASPGPDERIIVVGRDGWVHEPQTEEGLLRADLADPDAAFGRPLGLLALVCDRQGYRLHFSLGRVMRQRLQRAHTDGIVDFIADRTGSAPQSVSFYVDFDGPASFRSRRSLIISPAGSVPALVDLLRTTRRTVTLVLRPRASGRQFTPIQRLLLVLEPGDGPLLMQEALSAFLDDCKTRR